MRSTRRTAPGHDLRDGENVVASCTERTHHRSVAALIGHEPHSSTAGALPDRLDSERFLVGYRVRSEGDRRTDVAAGEPWIGIEQIAFRRTFAQLAKDQLDGDACAADHRPAHHDLGIDFDAVAGRHACRFRHRYGIDVKLNTDRAQQPHIHLARAELVGVLVLDDESCRRGMRRARQLCTEIGVISDGPHIHYELFDVGDTDRAVARFAELCRTNGGSP